MDSKSISHSKWKCQYHIVFITKYDGSFEFFTYIGAGHMEYIEDSKKPNGAHLFRIPMPVSAPEDIYFDFKLPG